MLNSKLFSYEGKCSYCELPFASNQTQANDYKNYSIIALDRHYRPVLIEHKKVCQDCLDEVWCGIQEAEQYDAIYGDFYFDEYTMSDSYRADVEAEKWDWLKDE